MSQTLDPPEVDVLVVGESLIDVIHRPDGSVEERPGGSPMNVAIGLSRLGSNVALLTSLGNDVHGANIRKHLALSSVRLLREDLEPHKTSTASATLASDGTAEYRFSVTWPRLAQPVPTAKVLHTGSIGLFAAPGDQDVLGLLATASAPTLVSIDPNTRAALVGNPKRARRRFEEAAMHAQLVKMSAEDLTYLYPNTPTNSVLDRLLTLGVDLAAVTDGPHGSVLATQSDRVRVPAATCVVADTVGAGDAYTTGLLHWLLRRGTIDPVGASDIRQQTTGLTPDQLVDLGEFATLIAMKTVQRVGADPPWVHELHNTGAAKGEATHNQAQVVTGPPCTAAENEPQPPQEDS